MGVAHFKKEWISDERLKPYLERMFHAEEAALELYLVDRKLASAFFRDIAFIEVALRNAINRLLAEKFGSDWYARAEVGFDARVRGNISEAPKIRNRVAHHEPLVLSGVPITGTNHRLSPRESFNAYMDLAAMLDRDLASFLEGLRTSDELKQAELLLDSFPD